MKVKNKILYLLFFFIILSTFILSDGSDSAETTLKPWSGWWWPIKEGGLATGIVKRNGEALPDWGGYPSPMQKYDMDETSNGKGPAFLWEYENHYNPDDLDWHGHCDAWAAASIVDSEPENCGEEKGIYFRVGDKKGLLTECNVGDVATIYGHRYNGLPSDDKDDIYPDLFHEKIIEYIKNRNEPIIIENDPGIEVWNYPCFRYEMQWTDEGKVRHVTTTLYLVSDAVDPDYVGTSYYPFTYTYDLYLNDSGDIIGGKWTGSSVNYHPDFIWEVDSVNPGNPELDYDEVKRISNLGMEDSLKDDLFAGNYSFSTAKEVKSGIYLLRYLRDDYFKLFYEEGESFSININGEKINRDLKLEIYDGDGNKLNESEYGRSESLSIGPLTGNGYIYIVVKGESPQENRRNYLLEIEDKSHIYYLPHLACDDGWNTEFLLYNPGDKDISVAFHFYQNFGNVALHRQFDPHMVTLSPGELLEGDFKTFFTDFTPSNERWLKIISDGEVIATSIFEKDGGGNIATMDFMKKPSLTLYFPHIAVTDTWWTGVAIVNVSDNINDITLTPYDSGGNKLDDVIDLSLSPHSRYVKLVSEIFDDSILPEIGYIKIDGKYGIVGYELFGTNDFTQFEGVTFEKKSFKNGFFIYTKKDGDWWDGLSLINVSGSKATVRITPLNSDGMNVYGVLNSYVEEVELNPGEKYVRLLSSIFSGYTNGEIAYLKIESNFPIYGFSLSGSFGSDILYGDLIFSADDVKKSYSYVFPFDLDKVKLILGNYSENSNVKVDIYGYDAGGNLLKEIDKYQIDFRKISILDLKEIFGNLNVKVIKLSSDKTFFSSLIYIDSGEGSLFRGE